MLHEIQRHILRKLTLVKKAHYAELKPKGVEGNLFVYHLRSLARDGYLEVQNKLYRLTPVGRRFVDRVSFETFRERIQPKIVTLVVLRVNDSYLLYRRRRSPFINRIGFPYGKIHLEERLSEAAIRELKEKTGLEATLNHRGDVYISAYDETELVSHMLCHVFVGTHPIGTLRNDTPIGECFWSPIKSIPKQELIPGVLHIINLIKKNPSSKNTGLFFAEYFLNTRED